MVFLLSQFFLKKMELVELGWDVIKLIFYYTSITDVVNFSSTNRYWRKIFHLESDIFKSTISLQRNKFSLNLVKDRKYQI